MTGVTILTRELLLASIIFLVVGGGNRFAELRTAAKERGLDDSFRFMPYQQQEMLPYSLSVPDAHWLSLNPQLEGLIVPSKFYALPRLANRSL